MRVLDRCFHNILSRYCNKNGHSGWVKWTIPGYEYLYVKCTEQDIFVKMMEYMEEQGIELAGAVHDFNCPKENDRDICFFQSGGYKWKVWIWS